MLKPLARLQRWMTQRRRSREIAQSLLGSSVAQSRRAIFYRDWGVADTLEGRFDMVALHVVLLVRRLQREGEAGRALGQNVMEAMFAALDDDMRELGVGDLTVPKRMHKAAGAFFGRLQAYDPALASGDAGMLASALTRNVPGLSEAGEDAALRLAAYALAAGKSVDGQLFENLAAGRVAYPDPETMAS